MAIQAIKALTNVGASHPSPWLNGPLAHLIPRLDPMGGIVMTNDGNAILREAVPKSTDTTCMLENCVVFVVL